ncbi:MAG: T9SS type A sorting domain-containing protein, partial [Bacteroidota bacterium]|nr:T9SS type A sorting domain-containing protein [Bacteroidota bacterium]
VREENTPINEEVTLSSSEFPYTYHGETYTAYGSYSVTEEDEYGCDQVYNLTLVANSGIAEIAEGLTISLYPNPTKANATLKVNGLNEQATIIITDQQGRVISSKVLPQGVDSMEVETDNLASGVYYIRVQTANTIRTEKLIKQ